MFALKPHDVTPGLQYPCIQCSLFTQPQADSRSPHTFPDPHQERWNTSLVSGNRVTTWIYNSNQWVITWYLLIIFLGYVFFSSPFSPRSTNTLESLPVLRYLIFLNLRLHAWLIFRSETFIAWTPTSLLSEKWFLHKNPTTFLKHRVLFFMPKKCDHPQKHLDIWQNVPAFWGSSIACISPSRYLMPPVTPPKKNGCGSRKLHCFFLTDASRSQKQCLCLVNKGTCRWQPLHI